MSLPDKRRVKPHPRLDLCRDRIGLIAGVDEAGRGPLAGPVVAAAVILDPRRRIPGLRDSKELSASQRERLCDQIRAKALCCAVSEASVEEIDRLNILQASLLAMRRAVLGLRLRPNLVLVDGNQLPVLDLPAEPVVNGDARIAAIAAASILAKVHRDSLCCDLDLRYPAYGFARHKGYATLVHREALRLHGACPEHRRSFAPVAQALGLLPLVELSSVGGVCLDLLGRALMATVKAISSRSNPLWQRLRKLAHQPTAYRDQGVAWVEGEHLCAEARRRACPVRHAVIGESAWELPQLRLLAQAADEILLVPDPMLAALSSMESAPPIAFVLALPSTPPIDPEAATVVLDRLQDAGNVGTILRSASAFGFVQVIALKGSAALWSPKVLRSGMGAHFGLRLIEGCAQDALDELNVPLLATSSHADEAIDAVELPWPCGWVMGHEGQGLSAEVSRRCSRTLKIAQPGGMESLNVAVAASICLYESSRQRMS